MLRSNVVVQTCVFKKCCDHRNGNISKLFNSGYQMLPQEKLKNHALISSSQTNDQQQEINKGYRRPKYNKQ